MKCVLAVLRIAALVHCKPKKELQIETVVEADVCTEKAMKGDTIAVHYTGMLTSGQEFDSSLKRGEPFQFKLGEGTVIKGWEKGVTGMCVGEKRKLVIPSHLAYGDEGAGGVIPPKATLIFEVELMGIPMKGGSMGIDFTLIFLVIVLGLVGVVCLKMTTQADQARGGPKSSKKDSKKKGKK